MVLIRNFILTVLSAFIVSGGVVFSASAQMWGTNTSATCDKDFADVMQARATMEAMREVEIAQTIILKPDSVLEYSCFYDRIKQLNRADNQMFTGNVKKGSPLFKDPVDEYTPPTDPAPYAGYLPTIDADTVNQRNFNGGAGVLFGPNAPLGALTTDTAGNILGVMITDSLLKFVYDNFGHKAAGGSYTGGVTSTCQQMNLVWNFLQCQNFKAHLFLTFEQMKAYEPRIYPVACNIANRATVWDATYQAANPELGDPGGIVEFETFFDQFNPSKCGASKPVMTGVRVYQGGPITDVFPDAVCPAPGCYYDGAANKCVK